MRGLDLDVVHGTPLMEAIIAVGLPLGRSCDGVALCGFCRVRVVAGQDNLSPIAAEERKVLSTLGAADAERLACCARGSRTGHVHHHLLG